MSLCSSNRKLQTVKRFSDQIEAPIPVARKARLGLPTFDQRACQVLTVRRRRGGYKVAVLVVTEG